MTARPRLPDSDTHTIVTHRRDVLMFRRIAVVVTGLLVTGVLTAGSAAAAPVDDHHHLSPREAAGLRFAGDVLDALFGGGQARHDRY